MAERVRSTWYDPMVRTIGLSRLVLGWPVGSKNGLRRAKSSARARLNLVAESKNGGTLSMSSSALLGGAVLIRSVTLPDVSASSFVILLGSFAPARLVAPQ